MTTNEVDAYVCGIDVANDLPASTWGAQSTTTVRIRVGGNLVVEYSDVATWLPFTHGNKNLRKEDYFVLGRPGTIEVEVTMVWVFINNPGWPDSNSWPFSAYLQATRTY